MMSKIVARYEYQNARGEPRLQKVRFEPKKFMWLSWSEKRGGWVRGVIDERYAWSLRALYLLPELLAALKLGEDVYLCEGEKDADALRSCGVAATSHGGGADTFEEGMAKWFLRGSGRLFIVCDNDLAGAYSGWLRYTTLLTVGVSPTRLRVVAPKWDRRRLKDAHDAVAASDGSLPAFRRVRLDSLKAAAFRYRTARIAPYSGAREAS